jgi:pimeloyl-ACP methyl ester carboxylesterase
MSEMIVTEDGLAHCRLGRSEEGEAVELLWGHGWGHTHRQLLPLAESVAALWPSRLIDFPGFGVAPPPPDPWGTEDYADLVAGWINSLPRRRRVWIGHSFGCRVGFQLATRHPGLVDGLLMIGAAGLRPRRRPAARFKAGVRRWAFKLGRSVTPEGPALEWLRGKFGSADYARAGLLRPTLVKVVNEDLSGLMPKLVCPVALVFGDRDTETPVEMGQRMKALNPAFDLTVLPGFGHNDILTDGRHQVVLRLSRFIREGL